MARIKSRFHACDLGPLPVEIVGRLLRCTLAPGIVHFSTANQDHAFERHAAEYLACFPHIAVTVLAPEDIGQSPHHPEGFEMVRAINELSAIGGSVLVAITLEIDEAQRYCSREPIHLRWRQGFADRLRFELDQNRPQGADTWREWVTVVLDDGVKLLCESGGFVFR